MTSMAPAKWHSEGRWDVASLQPTPKQTISSTKLTAGQIAFSQNGVATILLKQDYTKLFYLQKQPLNYPIESVTLTFKDAKNVRAMTITIYKQSLLGKEKKMEIGEAKKKGSYIEMVLYYDQKGKDGQAPITQQVTTTLFPQVEQAPMMLHKNIWIELNGLNQTIRIVDGDIAAQLNKPLFSYNFMFGNDAKDTWETAEDKYHMPVYDNPNQQPKNNQQPQDNTQCYNPRKKDFMNTLKYMDVSVQIASASIQEKYTQSLADFFEVRFMPLVRVFNSVIDTQPSLLNPNGAVLPAMSKGLNLIYGYLKDLSLLHLPNYPILPEDGSTSLQRRQDYLSWRQLNFAIHFSLTTPYGYRSEGGKLIPYGILNHLYQLKNGKKWTPLDLNRSSSA